MTGLASLSAVVAAAVGYMQVSVPLAGPTLTRGEAIAYWQVAVIAGLVVVLGSAVVAWLAMGAMNRKE